MDEAQSKDQAGFRAEFGCINYIFTLTAITKRANEFGKLLWIATVDFEKVFDSVEYKAIWTALLEQGIKPAYVTLLQRLYDGQEAVVHTDERSAPFKIENGTKQ